MEETESVHASATKFKSQSDKVKWAIIKKNMKYYMFLVILGMVSFFPMIPTHIYR